MLILYHMYFVRESAQILHCCVSQGTDQRHLICRFFVIIFLSSTAQMMVGSLRYTADVWDAPVHVIDSDV